MQSPALTPLSYHLLYWAVSALSVFLTAKIVPGFRIGGFFSAFVAALTIGFANVVVWPVVFFLTLPITIITLGLFLFVVNAIVLRICAALLPGFSISGWISAIFGSIVLSAINWGLHYLIL